MRSSVIMLKVYEKDILRAACGNFTKFASWVQLGT